MRVIYLIFVAMVIIITIININSEPELVMHALKSVILYLLLYNKNIHKKEGYSATKTIFQFKQGQKLQ
jgi:hypothetical protein